MKVDVDAVRSITTRCRYILTYTTDSRFNASMALGKISKVSALFFVCCTMCNDKTLSVLNGGHFYIQVKLRFGVKALKDDMNAYALFVLCMEVLIVVLDFTFSHSYVYVTAKFFFNLR